MKECALAVSLTACATSAAGAWTLPNASMTPGAILSSDPAVVCVRGYSRTVRPPYDYAWRRFRVSVFRAYDIPHERWHDFTLDHDVPLSLGGAPEDLRNVWPEPKAEAKRKDEVEDALLAAVCYRHTLTLAAAQAANREKLDADTSRAAGGSRSPLSGGRTLMETRDDNRQLASESVTDYAKKGAT
jgi:hypothetical protein